jgi:hypothetical protein
VLRRTHTALYAATEAPYLARAWVTLLATDPSMECRVLLLAPDRGTSCHATAEALVCAGDASPRCVATPNSAVSIPYAELIVLTFDPVTATYVVESALPDDLTPGVEAARARAAYAPARLIAPGHLTPLAASLLDRHDR